MSRKQRRKRARAKAEKRGRERASEDASAPESSGEAAEEPSRSGKRVFLLVGLVLLGLAGGAIFWSAGRSESPAPDVPEVGEWLSHPLVDLNVDRAPDEVRGPADAPVTTVEFSDFECPYCREASGVLRRVLEKFPEDVRLVYKYYPLDSPCNDALKRPTPWPAGRR